MLSAALFIIPKSENNPNIYLLDYRFIIKRYIVQEQPDGRHAQNKVCGKELRGSIFSELTTLTKLQSPTCKFSEPCLCFYRGFITLAIDPTSSPSPSRGPGGGPDNSNPLITGLVSLATSPHPQVLSKHNINSEVQVRLQGVCYELSRYLYHFNHLGNAKGFRKSVPETGRRPNIYFLLQTTLSQGVGEILN